MDVASENYLHPAIGTTDRDAAIAVIPVEDEYAQANARLIAASPMLLEACDNCQAVMDASASQLTRDDYVGPEELAAVANQLAEYAMQARAAIAAAEGSDSDD
jgi:hypothetical protein